MFILRGNQNGKSLPDEKCRALGGILICEYCRKNVKPMGSKSSFNHFVVHEDAEIAGRALAALAVAV